MVTLSEEEKAKFISWLEYEAKEWFVILSCLKQKDNISDHTFANMRNHADSLIKVKMILKDSK